MAWTTIPDKSTGDLMDETWYDTHFKANMEYLLDPNKSRLLRDNSGNYTTTSTTFTDVDATNLSITLTTHGGPVLVMFSAMVNNSYAANETYVDVDIDGTRIGNGFAKGLVNMHGGTMISLAFAVLATGLSAGSHTFKLQWCVDGNAGNMRSNSTHTPVHFSAIEI